MEWLGDTGEAWGGTEEARRDGKAGERAKWANVDTKHMRRRASICELHENTKREGGSSSSFLGGGGSLTTETVAFEPSLRE